MEICIERVEYPDGFRCEDKRFRLPFRVTAPCPICGEDVTLYLDGAEGPTDDYLVYPVVGAPFDLDFCHEGLTDGEYDDHEFSVKVILDFSLTAVTE